MMPGQDELNETASRANDQKRERRGNRGGGGGDGKDAEVPQGGKRRGPGRWVNPQASDD